MKKFLFYHSFLTDDLMWVQIFLDQFKMMVDSELYEELENIFVCVISSEKNLTIMNDLLNTFNNLFGNKIIMLWVKKDYSDNNFSNMVNDQYQKIIGEDFTLHKMWEFSHNTEEKVSICYIHMKGLTSLPRFLNSDLREYYSPTMVVNYHFWKKFLEWSVIEKHRECCEALETHDTAGANWSEWPIPHYSGNLWWANSDYVKTLIDPVNLDWWKQFKNNSQEILVRQLSDRIKDEVWIGSNNAKMFSLYNHKFPPPISNLGSTLIKRREYTNK